MKTSSQRTAEAARAYADAEALSRQASNVRANIDAVHEAVVEFEIAATSLAMLRADLLAAVMDQERKTPAVLQAKIAELRMECKKRAAAILEKGEFLQMCWHSRADQADYREMVSLAHKALGTKIPDVADRETGSTAG